MIDPVNVTRNDTIEEWRVKTAQIGQDLSNAFTTIENSGGGEVQSQDEFNLLLALTGTRWS